jgi:hypothetical protein
MNLQQEHPSPSAPLLTKVPSPTRWKSIFLTITIGILGVSFLLAGCNPNLPGTCGLYEIVPVSITPVNYGTTVCHTYCGKIGDGKMVQDRNNEFDCEEWNDSNQGETPHGMEFQLAEQPGTCYQRAPLRWACANYLDAYESQLANSSVRLEVAFHRPTGNCLLLTTSSKFTWVGIICLVLFGCAVVGRYIRCDQPKLASELQFIAKASVE